MKIGDSLALGLWLALESCAAEIDQARALLRAPECKPDTCERAEAILGRAWVRLEGARRALGPE